jgi:CRP-like cAMP-binding protein
MDRKHVNSIPLFARASRRQQELIATLADELEVPAGTTLTRQGGYSREFFVIESGTAAVTRDGELVASLADGDFFGEVGMIDGPDRTATVVASTPMRLLVLATREFRSLLVNVPPVADAVRLAYAERR